MCNISGKFQCETCENSFSRKTTLLDHVNAVHKGLALHSCNLCPLKFERKQNLRKHMRKSHSEKGSFSCLKCDKNFETEFILSQHKRKCMNESKTYECNLCFKTYLTLSGLSSHKKVFHEGLKNYACSQCDKTYTDGSPLRTHIATAHGESGSFKCSECDKVFAKEVHRNAHYYRNHVVSKEKIKCKYCPNAYHKYRIKGHEQAHIDYDQEKYKCGKCYKVFSRTTELKDHMRRKHVELENSKEHKCNECGKAYKAIEYLRKHISFIHKKSDAGRWICELCNKEFAQYGSLYVHKKRHLGKRFPCPSCEKVAKDETELKEHIKNKHDNPFKECPDCHKVLASTSFSSHKKTHLMIKPHKCNFCGLATSEKSNLKKHIAKAHLGEKDHLKDPVKCKECGSMVRNLKRHTRVVHEQKGKYPCTQCDYKSNTKHVLDVHQKRMHQESKIFCDLCPFVTTDLKGLEKHRKNTHNVIKERELLKCEYCENTYHSPKGLREHIKIKHKDSDS